MPPTEGTLVAFRRTDNSFHGHKPFFGPRRVVQLNWVVNRRTAFRRQLRHRLSAWVKRLLALIQPGPGKGTSAPRPAPFVGGRGIRHKPQEPVHGRSG